MSFSADWLSLSEECDALSTDTTLVTPLANKRFEIIESQERRIIIESAASGQTQPLQREQFETLVDQIDSSGGVFDLQRLPPDAEPYIVVLSLRSCYKCGERDGTIIETDGSTRSQLVEHNPTLSTDAQEHAGPNLDIYADMLLLIDALERHDLAVLSESEAPTLINLYTLLPNVQRNTGGLRQAAREILLDRLHHDQPVHGQYGPVRWTSQHDHTLKADGEVIALFEGAGISHERILAVDRKKVNDTFEVTDLPEADVYEIKESEYARRADVDEKHKGTRLQGLKDQLALNKSPDAEELCQEVEELEQRIKELIEFKPGIEIGSRS